MFRIALCLAIGAIAVIAPAGASASAADYEACSAGAGDKRALRQCNTFRTDVAECNALRESGGIDAPAQCMAEKLEAWRTVMEVEETRATVAGAVGDLGREDWEAGRVSNCRDAGQIRIATERFGPAYAEFEALQCELRAVIRRTLQRTEDRKGL
ncbi:MAG: hypothetical protein AAF968_09980 [Pseudomonadota bacterium]